MARRTVTAICAAAFILTTTAIPRAQELSDADRGAFANIILEQMAAFREGDGERAFSFAAPNIRTMFGTPSRFMAMVESGYEPVYRPSAVMMGEVTDELGGPTQRVHLIGPRGRSWIALYSMQRQEDGSWRIAACVLIPSPDAGA